jgi:hypothetical protein
MAMRTCSPPSLGVLLLGLLAGSVHAEQTAVYLPKDVQVLTPEPTSPRATPPRATPPQPDPPRARPECGPLGSGPDGVCDGAWENHVNYINQLCNPPPEHCFHWYLIGGVYFLKPHLEGNSAYLIAHNPTPGAAGSVVTGAPAFSYDPQFAPRVTLGGETDCGLGFRTTWWHFDAGANTQNLTNGDFTLSTVVTTVPARGVPGFSSPGAAAQAFGVFNDALTFGAHLNTHVWDWEVTRALHAGGWDMLLSGGVRYVYLSQSYEALRTNSGRGVSGTSTVIITRDQDVLGTGHNLNSAGPTAALEARRALGRTGFFLYGIGRGSVVFGRGRTRSFESNVESRQIIPRRGATTTFNATTVTNASFGHDDVLPIADVEIGLEWAHPVGPVLLFVQTGLVAQEWYNAGNAASEKGDLSLLGLNVTAGVNY